MNTIRELSEELQKKLNRNKRREILGIMIFSLSTIFWFLLSCWVTYTSITNFHNDESLTLEKVYMFALNDSVSIIFPMLLSLLSFCLILAIIPYLFINDTKTKLLLAISDKINKNEEANKTDSQDCVPQPEI